MSTCNFENAKNGIYVLKSAYTGEAYTGTDDPEGFEYEDSKDDFMSQLKVALKPWGWSVNQDYKDCAKYSIFDKNWRFAGSLEFKSGYYEGVQIIFLTAKDVNNERVASGDSRLGYTNKHYKNVLRLLKKFTICLQVACVFSNGEAVYEEVE